MCERANNIYNRYYSSGQCMCVSVCNSDLVKQKVTRARIRTDTQISISVSNSHRSYTEGHKHANARTLTVRYYLFYGYISVIRQLLTMN